MANEIKVSVVMAVYNAEKYLSKALDTVIAQTLKEIEIICVDDGSTDRSLMILEEYRKKDNRIKVLRHLEKTDGAAAARNLGMAEASGKYLSFLDSDDFFEPDMLEKAYYKAEEDNSEVVVFDAFVYDERLKREFKETWVLNHANLPGHSPFLPEECSNTLFRISMGAAWNAIFSRELVTRNNIKFESIHHTDDQVFVYLSYCHANRISILDERLLHYRKNVATSQSSMAVVHPEAGYMAPLVLKNKLEEKGLYQQYKNALIELALEIAHWHIERITDWTVFCTLYNALKDKYFKELDVFDADENTIEKNEIKWRDMVDKYSAEEYLLKVNAVNEEKKYLESIPLEVSGESKVVIYGAGVFGKEFFKRVFGNGIFRIVSWVDRNAESIGYPVKPVDSLKETEYDFIFVVIKYERVFEAIKKDLVALGIDESKIVWVNRID